MKKNIGLVFVATLILTSLVSCGKKEDTTSTTIANPWVDSDRAGVLEATGFDLPTQEGATDVAYCYTTEGNLAQVRYTIGQNEWTYRVETTEALEDISGMYYEWVTNEKETLKGHDAQLLAYSDATEDTEFIDDVFAVHVVNWYDESEGATHSLSVAGKDVDGLDIEVIVENMMMSDSNSASEFGPETGLYDRTYLVKDGDKYVYRMNDSDIIEKYDELYADAFQFVIDSYNDVMQYQNQSYDFSKSATVSSLVYSEPNDADVITVGSYFEMDYNFDLNNVGYTYVDLDSDGTFELIFGVLTDADADWIPEDYFERAFALVDGKAVHFVEGGSRVLFWLGSDGYIYETGSGGAAYSGTWKYHFDKSELKLSEDGVWGSEGLVGEEFLGCWERPVYVNEPFEDIDEAAKYSKYQITDEEWSKLGEEWDARQVKIDWIRFTDYLEKQ